MGAPVMECSDSDAPPLGTFGDASPTGAQLLQKGTTVGNDGSYEDACDDEGNLIEHVCETTLACNGARGIGGSSGAACAPTQQPTGFVTQHLIDCLGLCVDGTCEVPCPEPHDQLTVVAIDSSTGEHELDPGIEGLRYVCVRDACLAPPVAVGDVLDVTSVAAPDDVRVDCREPFGDTVSPLVLSDGCNYVGCSARRPSAP